MARAPGHGPDGVLRYSRLNLYNAACGKAGVASSHLSSQGDGCLGESTSWRLLRAAMTAFKFMNHDTNSRRLAA